MLEATQVGNVGTIKEFWIIGWFSRKRKWKKGNSGRNEEGNKIYVCLYIYVLQLQKIIQLFTHKGNTDHFATVRRQK